MFNRNTPLPTTTTTTTIHNKRADSSSFLAARHVQLRGGDQTAWRVINLTTAWLEINLTTAPRMTLWTASLYHILVFIYCENGPVSCFSTQFFRGDA